MKPIDHFKSYCTFWKPSLARRITLYFLAFGLIIFMITSGLHMIGAKKQFMHSTSKLIRNQFFRLSGAATRIAFSRDGCSVAAVGVSGEGKVWDIETQNEQHTFPLERNRDVAFSPVGKRLAYDCGAEIRVVVDRSRIAFEVRGEHRIDGLGPSLGF